MLTKKSCSPKPLHELSFENNFFLCNSMSFYFFGLMSNFQVVSGVLITGCSEGIVNVWDINTTTIRKVSNVLTFGNE